MDKPLTTEDLYGASGNTPDQNQSEKQAPTQEGTTLPFEETPEINPETASPVSQDEAQKTSQQPIDPSHELPPVGYLPKSDSAQRHRSGSGLGKIVFFLLLFAAGVWLSDNFRRFIPENVDVPFLQQKPQVTVTPAPSLPALSDIPVTGIPDTADEAWAAYQPVSGAAKQLMNGVRIKLPETVLSPICDSSNCVSQGTYLPGGTRFTIAPRGTGYPLPDYRGTAISDVAGITFTTKEISIAGRSAMEFIGEFTGRTVSGYAFTKMRGVMIPITDTTSLELNHFTPRGITADFDGDDVLFSKILQSLELPGFSTQKGAVIPVVSPSATPSVSLKATPAQ